MFIVATDHPECEGFAVVDEDNAEVIVDDGCHVEEADAQAMADTLNEAAGETAPPETEAEVAFIALMAVESPETIGESDLRVFPEGSFSWRNTPLPVHSSFTKAFAHDGAELSGRIEEVKRVPVEAARDLFPDVQGVNAVLALGVFDPKTPRGDMTAEVVESGSLTGISVDPGDGDVVTECLETAEDEFGEYCVAFQDVFLKYEIAGFTLIDVPGQKQAEVRLASNEDTVAFSALSDLGAGPGADGADVDDEAVVASVTDLPLPDRALFPDPEFDCLTPLTVSEPDEAGFRRLSGHVAPAEGSGICHIGYKGECKEAKPSPTSYLAGFRTGYMLTAQGDEIPTGVITMGLGHAPLRHSNGRPVRAHEAQAHYDNADAVVAFVNAGDDAYGWWVSGIVAPHVSDEQVMAMRGGSLSGDWRDIANEMEGIAIEVVNVPGFPIPRTEALVAGGRAMGLVAAGIVLASPCAAEVPVTRAEINELRREVTRQKALNEGREIDLLTASIHRHTDEDVQLLASALR